MIRRLYTIIKEFKIGIIELLLGTLMIIGFLGFFWKVNADLEWIDHTISFITFTFLFYKVSLTSILFGKKNRFVDGIVVFSYFLFFFKDILIYTNVDIGGFVLLSFIKPVYNYLISNHFLINSLPFFLASLGLLYVAIYATFKLEIVSPSLMNALIPKELRTIELKSHIRKFLIVFSLLLAFYYFVYNTILEWLEFTIDDPIIAIGIVFFIYKVIKHKEKFHKESFVFKILDFGSGIYRRFVSLFHYRKTLLLGISGIIVLHLLSDLGVYVLSYTTWISNIYINYLGDGHTRIIDLLIRDLSNSRTLLESFGITHIYILNILALLSFLALPVFLWANLFKQREFKLNKYLISIILISYLVYTLYPVFNIQAIHSQNLVGVDIRTFSFFDMRHLPELIFSKGDAITFMMMTSAIIFFLLLFLSSNKKVLNKLLGVTILCSLLFVGYYLYNFSKSQVMYLVTNIYHFLRTYQIFFAIIFSMILLITILFYILGYFTLIYEIGHEYHNKKWSNVIDKDLKIVLRKIRKYEERN